MVKSNPNLLNWFLLLLLGAVWGTSFILIKTGLKGFPPLQLASLRIVVSFIALVGLLPFYFRKIKVRDIRYIFFVGLLGSGIPPFMYAFAQTRIESAMAGIINSAVPIFTFIIGILFFKAVFSWLKLSGVLIGLAGAIMLLIFGVSDPSTEVYLYGSLILVATLCYALSVNIVKTYLQNVNAIAITVVSFTIMGIPAMIYLFTTDFMVRVQAGQQELHSFLAIVLLAVMGTALANIIYFYLTQRTTALFASTVTYLIPIVAVFWGIGAGENITIIHFYGMLMILFGVYLAGNRKKPFMKQQ